ncbi:metastasis suppressor protein 1-like [Ctenocephalides felis]|uniref:metastasis suppressor protein 1-like n=1 Tax=Ctenocephalides felis TaxID=7515 RepID=UPI000E6E28BA|nr:metastasis suppressor protein 1-like [Ctenocephalides felis]
MDSLVIPLQEKLEDWKKGVINLEKEHLKEFKRGRSDLKKYSTDTLRIQRKAKKGNNNELQGRVESCLQDVTECKLSLAEVERRAVRAAMTEERARFCQFYELLEPVVQQEMAVLGELSHLQDATDQLRRLTLNPRDLPPSSEQVVVDTKFRSSPSSPQSLGSRKGSACSISSLNSNSSSSGLSPGLSPGQNLWQRNSPQATNINHGDSGSAALVTKSESSSSRSHVETVSERPHTISAGRLIR